MQFLANMWTHFSADSDGWKMSLTFMSVLVVLVSAVMSYIISHRSTYLTTVTADRSKWIASLRENLAKVSSLLFYIDDRVGKVETPNDSEHYKLVRELTEKVSLVQLQLSPLGRIDTNILEIIRVAIVLVNNGQPLGNTRDLLIAHSQWLLKEEWEKVKFESGSIVRRGWSVLKRIGRYFHYRRFCAASGSVKCLTNLIKARAAAQADIGSLSGILCEGSN